MYYIKEYGLKNNIFISITPIYNVIYQILFSIRDRV